MSTPLHQLQASVLRWGLRLLSATWRFKEDIPDDCRRILDGDERAVVAFWHGKMLPVWYRFHGGAHAALVSGSRDGELLAGYLREGLGYQEVIRGSSSRGGSEALAAMVDALARRSCLITPDGPRGPARQAKAGAMVAALRSGVPVLLAGWSCRRSIRLGSWDHMEIPYPFSIINFRYCKGRFQPTETSRENMDTEAGAGSMRIDNETLRCFNRTLDELNRSSSGERDEKQGDR